MQKLSAIVIGPVNMILYSQKEAYQILYDNNRNRNFIIGSNKHTMENVSSVHKTDLLSPTLPFILNFTLVYISEFKIHM